MQPDIIVGNKYVALNSSQEIIDVPLWSIVTPTKIAKNGLVAIKVTEPSEKSYNLIVGYEKFVHLFKPIHSEWVTNALKRGPLSEKVWEFIVRYYLGE